MLIYYFTKLTIPLSLFVYYYFFCFVLLLLLPHSLSYSLNTQRICYCKQAVRRIPLQSVLLLGGYGHTVNCHQYYYQEPTGYPIRFGNKSGPIRSALSHTLLVGEPNKILILKQSYDLCNITDLFLLKVKSGTMLIVSRSVTLSFQFCKFVSPGPSTITCNTDLQWENDRTQSCVKHTCDTWRCWEGTYCVWKNDFPHCWPGTCHVTDFIKAQTYIGYWILVYRSI